MKSLRLIFLLLCLASAAQAQISVTLSIKQRFHLLHEPVVATVNVTNQLGRAITLSDSQEFQWFGFRILAEGDRNIPPRDLSYHVPPLVVKPGETVKRSVDLTQLYELGEVGNFRVQAQIYYSGLDKFYASRPMFIDVSEGRVLWRRIAGVPEGQPNAGQMRIFSLLTHQVGESNTLYVRVEGKDDGIIYCTYPIGRLLDGVDPQAEFDSSNNLYVLHLIGMRAYMLTKVSPDGEYGGQINYSAPKTRPTLRRTPEGGLQIIGGQREQSVAQHPPEAPKLSDRPAGFPKN
jgi:hypothetical protein